MEAFIQSLAEFIARHAAWAGLVLGVVTLLESLVLIGAFIPATALMVVAGGLIAAGVLDPLQVVLWCVAGAIVGDAVSFELGRRLGPRALRHPMFRGHRRKVARTRLFNRRYGSASIFIGRFFGPLRAFVPLVAGLLQMRRRTFQVANALSAAVWVLAILAPGYFAAKGLAELEALGEAHLLTIGAITVTGLVIIGVVAREILRRRAAPPRPVVLAEPRS
ncbi:DedA family protein [Phenylobacterium sp.]|uniref:DedA family protein n=1 Tax=Phenylobacterium sp. TaxID=1871053 RepID=UPI0028A1BE32|nr:DedA family protein [Phenylobacterium sp.]